MQKRKFINNFRFEYIAKLLTWQSWIGCVLGRNGHQWPQNGDIIDKTTIWIQWWKWIHTPPVHVHRKEIYTAMKKKIIIHIFKHSTVVEWQKNTHTHTKKPPYVSACGAASRGIWIHPWWCNPSALSNIHYIQGKIRTWMVGNRGKTVVHCIKQWRTAVPVRALSRINHLNAVHLIWLIFVSFSSI